MKLFTNEQYKLLLENGAEKNKDHAPVVKLTMPEAGYVWLISAIVPGETNIAYGLTDLRDGRPEMGYIYLPEIMQQAKELELKLSHEPNFSGEFSLSVYARLAEKSGFIVYDRLDLTHMQAQMEEK